MLNMLLFGMPGGTEWLIIGIAVLLFFGGRKIPELMRGLGRGIREFNDARDQVKDNLKEGMKKEDEDAKRIESQKSNSSTD